MVTIFKKLTYLILLMLIYSITYCQTNITSSTITTTTWTLNPGLGNNGSPYNIHTDITIPAGNTLTIEAGVEVIFHGDYKLYLVGDLIAVGTSSQKIDFRKYSGNPIGWQGIIMGDMSTSTFWNGVCKLVYCKIHDVKKTVPWAHGTQANPDKSGAVYINCNDASPSYGTEDILIDHTEIYDNEVSSHGGGIFCISTSSNTRIQNCNIHNNKAFRGGGISIKVNGGGNNYINEVYVYNNEIHNNEAINGGGGIWIKHKNNALNNPPSIILNSIEYNKTTGGVTIPGKMYGGAGISIYKGKANILNNTLKYNEATYITNNEFGKGGGLYINSGFDVNLEGNTIELNTAEDNGGGIYVYDCAPQIKNGNSINSNEALNGGGIYFENINTGILVVNNNSSISNNIATLNGGGIYFSNASSIDFTSNIGNNGSNVALNGAGFYLEGSSPTISSSMIITNGIANENGGGIYIDPNSNPIGMDNIDFIQNRAEQRGGAIYLDNPGFSITGGLFSGNHASFGGAIYCLQSLGNDISNNSFSSNTADEGGAIYLETNTSPTISSNSYNGNQAFLGGGLYINDASPNINDVIQNNSATNGGGIYVFGSSANPTFSNTSEIKNNNATYGGGLYIMSSGATVSNVSVSENVATTDGGGVYLNDYSGTISTVDCIDNDAAKGGAMYIYNSNSGTIYNCTCHTTATPDYGGALYLDNSSIQVTGNNISNNGVNNDGGAIYITNGSDAEITSNIITSNSANSNGGAIFIDNSSNPEINLNSISSNMATNGAGIYSINSSPDIHDNADFTLNDALNNGGGIYINGGTPTINNNDLVNNDAVKGGGLYIQNCSSAEIFQNGFSSNGTNIQNSILLNYGGGIYCLNSDPNIYENSFTGNAVDMKGGGAYFESSNASFYKNNLMENTANGDGGGIYFTWENSSPPTAFNNFELNEFRDNEATNGAGIAIVKTLGYPFSTFSLLNNLIVTNSASGDGGGVYLVNLKSDPPIINSNTIADNFANLGTEMFSDQNITTTSFYNNIIWNSTYTNVLNTNLTISNYQVFDFCDIKGCGGVNNNIDALPLFHGNGNYRVHNNPPSLVSPCIDAGNYLQTITSKDLDGNTRVLFLNIDMGAYEHDGVNWRSHSGTTSDVVEENEDVQLKFDAHVYPNPVTEKAFIQIDLPNDDIVTIEIFDVLGKIIWKHEAYLQKGQNSIPWEVGNIRTGIYLCKINLNNDDPKFINILIN